jgi:hypothetical protein
VNMVMSLRFYKMLGNYRVATQLVASRIVLSSTKLVISSVMIAGRNDFSSLWVIQGTV